MFPSESGTYIGNDEADNLSSPWRIRSATLGGALTRCYLPFDCTAVLLKASRPSSVRVSPQVRGASETLSLPGVPTPEFQAPARFESTTSGGALRLQTRAEASGGFGVFRPTSNGQRITYHPRISAEPGSATTEARAAQWRVLDSHVELDTVGKGQEFVFDTQVYSGSVGLVRSNVHMPFGFRSRGSARSMSQTQQDPCLAPIGRSTTI